MHHTVEMLTTRNAPFSRLAIAAVMTIVVTWTCLKAQPWQPIISWDAFGYYLYLPAGLLHQDIALMDMSWFEDVFRTYEPSGTVYQINAVEDGGHAIKYSMGLAILWAPFFALGHLIAQFTGYPADGFSRPYEIAMFIATWSYLLLGLTWSRKALLNFFNDRSIALTICLLVLGTNVFDQSVFHMMMPHIFLFTLFAGILHYTIRWERHRRTRHLIVIALLIGLSALVRPTAIVVVVIPLLWGWSTGKVPMVTELLRKHPLRLLIACVVIGVVCLPQLLYWKKVTGGFFYMGYRNPGEGFDLGSPHIGQVLFSFRKGWLLYTPLMVCALLGFALLRGHAASGFRAIVVFCLVHLYIVSSWSCWWYADSFGHRAMLESYAFLLMPLCAFVSGSLVARIEIKCAALVGFGAFVVLNLFQTWQCSEGILHSSRMTRKAYAMVFGEREKPPGLEEALLVQRAYDGSMDPPDLSRYIALPVVVKNYDAPEGNIPADQLTDTVKHSGARSLFVDPKVGWSPSVAMTYSDLTSRDHLWVRFTLHVYVPPGSPRVDCALAVCMEHRAQKYGDRVRPIAPEELVPGQWNEVSMWFLTPAVRDGDDLLYGYLWLRDTVPVWIDDARIEPFERKE